MFTYIAISDIRIKDAIQHIDNKIKLINLVLNFKNRNDEINN